MAGDSDHHCTATIPAFPGKTFPEVGPGYSKVSEQLRRISAGSLQCSLFCGGQRCKYESASRWNEDQKALSGVFSHWVRADILAMARPSTALFREGKLIEEMKRVGIGSVINLQLPWEHSKCGPGLEPSSGFTYRPEELMNQGVYFYNYGWLDYGVPTVESVLNMVKVLDFALQEGSSKVAVHCHAGLGRTGVLIAGYLVYSERLSGEEAIAAVREKRPGSIQTRPQIDIVRQFAAFLLPLWILYPATACGETLLTLSDCLTNQALLLHGEERQRLKHTPKVVADVCEQLVGVAKRKEGVVSPVQPNGRTRGDWELTNEETSRLTAIQAQFNSSLQWSLLLEESNQAILVALLCGFFRGLAEPCFSSHDLPALRPAGDHARLPLGSYRSYQCVVSALRVLPSLLPAAACEHLACSLLQSSEQATSTHELADIIHSHLINDY